jgi:hypothetical protein
VAVDFDLGEGVAGFIAGEGDAFDLAHEDGEGGGGHSVRIIGKRVGVNRRHFNIGSTGNGDAYNSPEIY